MSWAMSSDGNLQANLRNKLRKKLGDLITEKQQVEERIREIEKQIDLVRNNTTQSG
jgi:uncharacterized protein (UPF0218 family)